MPHVLLVSSVNMDLVVWADTFPPIRESPHGSLFATHPGSTRANREVAAARFAVRPYGLATAAVWRTDREIA